MVIMVFVLAGMVTSAVLVIWQGWLGWTVMGERGWYGLGVCMVNVYVLRMWLALIGGVAGLGEGLLRYNWLVEKLIIPPCICRKPILNTTGKMIFLVTTSCSRNVLWSIAMDRNVLPSTIRGLSLQLKSKTVWVAVVGLRTACSIIVRPRGL